MDNTTNEEAIKDVQYAQSSLTEANQILMDFFAKAGEGKRSHITESVFLDIFNVKPDSRQNSGGRYQCLQLTASDSKVAPRGTSSETEAIRIFDEFTGKNGGMCLEQCEGRRLRFSSP